MPLVIDLAIYLQFLYFCSVLLVAFSRAQLNSNEADLSFEENCLIRNSICAVWTGKRSMGKTFKTNNQRTWCVFYGKQTWKWAMKATQKDRKKPVKSYYGRSLQEVKHKKKLSVLTETTASNPYTYRAKGSKKPTSAGNFLTLLILFGVVLTFVGSEIDLHDVVCSLFFFVSSRCYVDEVLLVRTPFLETWNSIDYNKRRNETRKKIAIV